MSDESRTQWQKIELPGEGDRKIYLEVLNPGGREEVGVLDSIPFEQITDILGSLAHQIGQTLEKTKPTKASVELGVEFGIKDGVLVTLIARGSGKANLKIGIEWERSKNSSG